MVSSRRPGTVAALFVSLFLLGEGAWGLVHPPAYGILPTNTLRAAIHLVFGVLGLLILRTGQVRGYLKIVGTIVALVGVGYFLPVIGDIIRSMLAVDRNGALINIAVGVIALLASRAEKHTGPKEPRDRTAYKLQ
jgi:hypothetical protein